MKKGNLYETRLWNKYREQLEIIEIVLTAKKLTKQDLKP